MVVISISDVMTLNFFWMVRDEGSWLEIGTTISHFVIGSLLCVFVAGLEGLSEVLIEGVSVEGTSGNTIRERGGVVVNSRSGDGVNGKVGLVTAANGHLNGYTAQERKDERPIID